MLSLNWSSSIGALLVLLFIQLAYYFFREPPAQPGCEVCPKPPEAIEVFEAIQDPQKLPPFQRRRIEIDPNGERAKAAIVILARNGDLDGLKSSISMFEERFNSKFNYPYVFLNEVPFTELFKSGVRALSKSNMSFGLIPEEHWSYPNWVNVTKASECLEDMERRKIKYGGSLPYRHMCRFNSGFFFHHPLLDEYEYYWRVEPSVEFVCDIDYDPFMFMKKNDKKYGWVIMMTEYKETIPTLWETTQKFMEEHKALIPQKNSLKLIRADDGGYNGCHFWSNFEIASLEFLRSKEYLTYFDYLDKTGGFFYERWGDAPVHTLAAAMFLPIEQVHYFVDIGYSHDKLYNCPASPSLQLNCKCNPHNSISSWLHCYRIYRQISSEFSY